MAADATCAAQSCMVVIVGEHSQDLSRNVPHVKICADLGNGVIPALHRLIC
uniref:Uncharacterized protein n=1 Tax=Arundo donax TaxID=35708 RepID=A0A0A9CL24_ARUDO